MFDTKKLMLRITYTYTAAAPAGAYTIGLSDPMGSDFQHNLTFMMAGFTASDTVRMPFTIVAGSFRLGPEYTLTVQSRPISGIPIGGDKPGTTDYTAKSNGLPIALTAPSFFSTGGTDYDFVRWTVDGANRPDGEVNVSITMDADRTAVAIYEARPFRLTVQSRPGITISGDKPGTGSYSATCRAGQVVCLSAPHSANLQGVNYCFSQWVVDGTPATPGEMAVTITMDADHAIAAQYDICAWTVSVVSFPTGTAAEITGDRTGTTPFSVGCTDGEILQLAAPATISVAGKTWYFVYWLVDSSAQQRFRRDLYLTVTHDTTATAVYDPSPRGDVNGDCRVNVLDLVEVRNRLYQTCSP